VYTASFMHIELQENTMLRVPAIFDHSSRFSPTIQAQSKSEHQAKWKVVLNKVWRVTRIILAGLAGAAMFATNPTVFTLGFISGVIWDNKVQEIIDKVKSIWKSQTWGVLLLTGIASFLALQVTWAAGSVLFAANLGCIMAQRAQEYVIQ